LRDIFVSIKTLEDLNNIEPNFEKISQISKKYNVIGYHLFTLGTLFSSTAHCRNFAPLYDINEEAAT
jgi:predicted PhzF superfamily epimerase YddE/YHI9